MRRNTAATLLFHRSLALTLGTVKDASSLRGWAIEELGLAQRVLRRYTPFAMACPNSGIFPALWILRPLSSAQISACKDLLGN